MVSPEDIKSASTSERTSKSEHLAIFHEIGKALTSTHDLNEILEKVMLHISDILHPENWSLLLIDEETDELYFEILVGLESQKLKKVRLKRGEGIAGHVSLTKEPLLVKDVSKDARFSHKGDLASKFKTTSIVCVPLVIKDKCLGVIELLNAMDNREFTDDDLLALTAIADYTAIAIENSSLIKKLQEMTIRDDLTQLYNSRFLHNRIEYEVERAKRFKNEISMIFLDIDFFKEINDSHGHQSGSKILIEVGDIIYNMVRHIDMACRYGGDEFVILMPQTSKKNAFLLAEKLRVAIGNAVYLKDDNINCKITASFGVASYPEDASTSAELIHKADNAMYIIKNSSKDGVAEA